MASAPASTVWQPGREDRAALLLVALLPIVAALPQLTGLFITDPLVYRASIASGVLPGWLPGQPTSDPNDGFQTQALGVRAALDWLEGTVPWWNPYSGVGLPLAAEYQPAAFFPLTFLLLLPKGMLLQQLALQVLAGIGTYGLLRQGAIGREAAAAGAIVFAFNGTLAVFAHGPAQAVPFIPWMIWAIERAYAKAPTGLPGGWRMLAFAMAMSLLAGFPETAYIGGLLALAWAVTRGVQLHAAFRVPYARRIALGGVVGIAIAAPQVAAFFLFLPHADIGLHASDFAHAFLPRAGVVPTLAAPFFHGPIHALETSEFIWHVWGSSGGFVTLALVTLAIYGFAARRGPLGWLLAGWVVLAIAKTFGSMWISTLWNLIPGIALTVFARYAQPSWALALVILAAWGLDALRRGPGARPGAQALACLAPLLAVASAALFSDHLWPYLIENVRMRNWALGSAVWALGTSAACLWLIRRSGDERRRRALAAVLVVDAVMMFSIPRLSAPRAGDVDYASMRFLRDHLGMQRFFSMGPIEPNYGAYFGLGQVNHNYLPLPKNWAEFVRTRLDTRTGTPPFGSEVFNGARHRGDGNSGWQLYANIDSYREAGVRFVVVSHPHVLVHPFVPVRESAAMKIYELPGFAPYLETRGATCRIEAPRRTEMTVDCAAAATLVRRELYFPGWRATVDGAAAKVEPHGPIFQSIALPAGRSTVRFAYAPPGIGWAWLACAVGVLAFAAPLARRARTGSRLAASGRGSAPLPDPGAPRPQPGP